jgi:hypothetical protein
MATEPATSLRHLPYLLRGWLARLVCRGLERVEEA